MLSRHIQRALRRCVPLLPRANVIDCTASRSLASVTVGGAPTVGVLPNRATDLGASSHDTHAGIQSATVDATSKCLVVQFRDGSTARYPNLLLRDFCQCSQCWSGSSMQRLTDLFSTVSVELEIKKVELLTDGTTVSIDWNDGHRSDFSSDFLSVRRLPENPVEPKPHSITGLDAEKKVWDAEAMQDHIPRIEFEQVMREDNGLYTWLMHVVEEGICIIENAPLEAGQVEELTGRVHELRSTHYGDVFSVVDEPSPSSVAYMSHYLPLHSDLPYYIYNPCVQILHCVAQAKVGAENGFVDTLNVAQQLKRDYPEDYELLTTLPIRYYDIENNEDPAKEFDFQIDRPVIDTDQYGNPIGILHSNFGRGFSINASPEVVQRYYKVLYNTHRLLNSKDNLVTNKMNSGDILTFDNRRVLHSRNEYSSRERRQLHGVYLDYDYIYARLRVLQRKLFSRSVRF